MAISKRFRYKDKEGKVTDYEYGVNGPNVTQDANHRLVTDKEKETWNGKANPEDIPSGAAADYGVANNDTTNRSDMLVTAQVAYQHGREIDQLISELDATKQSFQAGVDTLYNKCSSCGATPSEKTPTAISTAIQTIYNNRYNEGINAGTAGYSFTSRIAGGEQRSTVYFPLQRVSSVTVYGSTINQYPCIEIKIAGELVYSRYSAYDSHSIPNITRSVSGGNVQVDVWGINNQHTAIDLYIATA